MKINYWKKILKAIIVGIEENRNVPEIVKNFNPKDAVHWIAEVWNSYWTLLHRLFYEVKLATIIKPWRKIIDTKNAENAGKFNVGSNELLNLVMKLPFSESINKEDVTG